MNHQESRARRKQKHKDIMNPWTNDRDVQDYYQYFIERMNEDRDYVHDYDNNSTDY